MSKKNYSNVQDKEVSFLFQKKPLTIVEQANKDNKTSEVEKREITDNEHSNDKDNLEEITVIPKHDNIKISTWKNRKISISTSLIPLRTALFLWFASGSICAPMFSLMLTSRGLTLIEFSSVFSMLFLSQFIVAYICGILADKLGNAKPIVLFLMLGATFVLIGFLFLPNFRDNSCLNHNLNETCRSVLNYTSDLEFCKYTCSINNTGYSPEGIENITGKSSIPFVKTDLNFSQTFQDEFYSNGTDCNETCSCFNQLMKNCLSASKVELKIIYSCLILSFFSFWSTTYRFLDFTSLNVAKQENSHFGNERFYGMLGAVVATFLCNFVLTIDKSGSRRYYDNVFWFSVILDILALLSACKIKKFILPPGLKLTKKTIKLFTDIEILSIICVSLVCGTAYTFNHFYHLWFLDSLKASKIVIGIHLMSSSVYSLPILKTSKWWIRKLGKKTIIIMSPLFYAINGVSYSFLYYPWVSLVIEITKAFSYHLFFISLVVHCREIAPEGFAATVNAVVGTIHTGVGRSISVSVGGYLMSTFGARTTYRILAGICSMTAILYSTFLCLRKFLSKKNCKEKSENPEEMHSMKENVD